MIVCQNRLEIQADTGNNGNLLDYQHFINKDTPVSMSTMSIISNDKLKFVSSTVV